MYLPLTSRGIISMVNLASDVITCINNNTQPRWQELKLATTTTTLKRKTLVIAAVAAAVVAAVNGTTPVSQRSAAQRNNWVVSPHNVYTTTTRCPLQH